MLDWASLVSGVSWTLIQMVKDLIILVIQRAMSVLLLSNVLLSFFSIVCICLSVLKLPWLNGLIIFKWQFVTREWTKKNICKSFVLVPNKVFWWTKNADHSMDEGFYSDLCNSWLYLCCQTKLVITHMVTKRYLKLSNLFSINLMSAESFPLLKNLLFFLCDMVCVLGI